MENLDREQDRAQRLHGRPARTGPGAQDGETDLPVRVEVRVEPDRASACEQENGKNRYSNVQTHLCS